jgi:hypothetical protein
MRVLQTASFGKLPYERLTGATCDVEGDVRCRMRHAKSGVGKLTRATGSVEGDVRCRVRQSKLEATLHVALKQNRPLHPGSTYRS